MDPAEHERRTKTAAARRWNRQWHLVDRERSNRLPEALKLGDGHPRACPARINELSAWGVIAEQQRTDPMPTALGIAPSDNHKFFSVEALGFQPGAPVRFISAADALGHDAFKAILAGQPVESRAMADLVVVVSERLRRADQECFQPYLPIHKRQRSEILAIQEQEIEQEEDQGPLAAVAGVLDQIKR